MHKFFLGLCLQAANRIRRKALGKQGDQAIGADLWMLSLSSLGFTWERPFITFCQLLTQMFELHFFSAWGFALAPLGATVSQQGLWVGGSMPRLPHSRGGCRGRQQFLEILRSSILQWQPTFSFSPSLSHLLHCVTCGFRIHFPNKLPAPKPLSNHLLWGNSK